MVGDKNRVLMGLLLSFVIQSSHLNLSFYYERIQHIQLYMLMSSKHLFTILKAIFNTMPALAFLEPNQNKSYIAIERL